MNRTEGRAPDVAAGSCAGTGRCLVGLRSARRLSKSLTSLSPAICVTRSAKVRAWTVTVAEASGGIAAAADRLKFYLTDHASTLARAKGCNAAIEERLAAIQDHGELKEFHKEYQKRRREAEAAGLRFPSYNTVRGSLAGVAGAGGGRQPLYR